MIVLSAFFELAFFVAHNADHAVFLDAARLNIFIALHPFDTLLFGLVTV
jgi:hypothetical protein